MPMYHAATHFRRTCTTHHFQNMKMNHHAQVRLRSGRQISARVTRP